MQAVGDPTAPMLIALAADGIGATQEGPAHTAVNEVIPGRGIQRDERGTGLGHGCVRWVECYSNVARQEGLSSKWVSYLFTTPCVSPSLPVCSTPSPGCCSLR